MRRAAIDIGTNSCRLLLAEMHNGRAIRVKKLHNTVRTGEGVNASGVLNANAIQRTVNAVMEYAKIGREWAGDVFCFATSAVRDAKNKGELCQKIQEQCGVKVEILSGDEEARCGFAGVFDEKSSGGILDIGGGSTEVMLGDNGEIKFAHSFNIGCVRGTEMFGQNGAEILSWAYNSFGDIDFSGEKFWAIGGTGTSAAAMDLGLKVYDPDIINGYKVSIGGVERLFEKLNRTAPEDRKRIAGLEPNRADIILAGIAIMLAFMKKNKLDAVFASENDNLEGYLNLKG